MSEENKFQDLYNQAPAMDTYNDELRVQEAMALAYKEGFNDSKIEDIRKGCGDEFMSEDGDFELMCGKHIWDEPGKVSQYNLCSGCQSAVDVLCTKDEEVKG